MPGFDQASVAALLAALTARAEGQQFSLTSAATQQPYVDHPYARLVRPTSAARALVTWRAVYRSPTYSLPVLGQGGAQGRVVGYDQYPGISRAFGPDSLVCDTANLLMGQGLLLLWAQFQFDLHDLRMKQASRAPVKFP